MKKILPKKDVVSALKDRLDDEDTSIKMRFKIQDVLSRCLMCINTNQGNIMDILEEMRILAYDKQEEE